MKDPHFQKLPSTSGPYPEQLFAGKRLVVAVEAWDRQRWLLPAPSIRGLEGFIVWQSRTHSKRMQVPLIHVRPAQVHP